MPALSISRATSRRLNPRGRRITEGGQHHPLHRRLHALQELSSVHRFVESTLPVYLCPQNPPSTSKLYRLRLV